MTESRVPPIPSAARADDDQYSATNELDRAMVEAAMVLLGTDVQRILIAVGLHLQALDLGDLVLQVERVNHGQPDQTDIPGLHRWASEWWHEQRRELPSVLALAHMSSMADPREALPALVMEIQLHSGHRLGESTAILLAVCFLARHGLSQASQELKVQR